MRAYEYNSASDTLADVGSYGKRLGFLRRAAISLGFDSPVQENTAAVDRSWFFNDADQLKTAIDRLPIQFCDPDDETADTKTRLPFVSSMPEVGTVLDSYGIENVFTQDSETRSRILEVIATARRRRTLQAEREWWWRGYSNQNEYEYNPFDYDPTEQLIIGQDHTAPVSVYNFGEHMTRRHVHDTVGAVAVMSELTQGYTRLLTPTLVVHDAFKPIYFEQSATHDKPAGRAWLGEPFVEFRRTAFEGQPGTAGQSWLQQMIAHEITHQIDHALNPGLPDFTRYFHYIDENGDGVIDYTHPHPNHARNFHPADVAESSPNRRYGLTDGSEDISVAAEEVPFRGRIDPLRRSAYLSIISQYVNQEYSKYGQTIPNPAVWKVERRTGNEIQLPLVSALQTPLQLRLGKASRADRFFAS